MTIKVATFLYTLLAILSPVTLTTQFSHAQRLESFGLEGMRITDLAAGPKYFGSSPQYLFATTDNSGIFRRSLTHSDSEWVSLGLQGKKLTALDIYIWGAGPIQFYTPVVGVAPDYSQGDSTLVYRYEENKWVPADSGMLRIQAVTALTSFHTSGHEPPGAIFAIGSDLIFKSSSSIRFWTEIYKGGIGPGIVVIEAAQNSFGKEVWAGGFTESYISAFVLKSQNAGKTWEEILLPPAGQINNSCNALTFHPTDSAIIYAGVEEAVLKTTDGGQTWNFTGLRDTDVSFRTVTLDPFISDYVYAGGASRQSNLGALWESFDAGVSWRQVSLTQQDTLAAINEIVHDQNTSGVIYLATTGTGVWKYTSLPTSVSESFQNTLPHDYLLEQNFPNPFQSGTTIRFQLHRPKHVTLEIYNLQGYLVNRLADKIFAPGTYMARWDGNDSSGAIVSAGVYFYRLQGGSGVAETRKMIILKELFK